MKQNITITKLIEKLEEVDEIILLELLEITSEDILERFRDRVEDKESIIIRDFFEEDEDHNNSC